MTAQKVEKCSKTEWKEFWWLCLKDELTLMDIQFSEPLRKCSLEHFGKLDPGNLIFGMSTFASSHCHNHNPVKVFSPIGRLYTVKTCESAKSDFMKDSHIPS